MTAFVFEHPIRALGSSLSREAAYPRLALPSCQPLLLHNPRLTLTPLNLRRCLHNTQIPAILLHLAKFDLRHKRLALPSLRHPCIKFIDFLKRQALSLVDAEPNEGNANETERTPDEEDFGLEVCVSGAVVDEVRGGVGDCPVKEPVA